MRTRATSSLLLLVGLGLVLWSFSIVLKRPAPAKYQPQVEIPPTITTHTLRVGNYVLPVEIADTDRAREQGFSGRERPLSGHGILFVFDSPGTYGFWMKEMKFPLDIIWIDQYWTVIGLEREATPESYPEVFDPPVPIQYVLELPAGDAAAFSIDRGVKLFLDR